MANEFLYNKVQKESFIRKIIRISLADSEIAAIQIRDKAIILKPFLNTLVLWAITGENIPKLVVRQRKVK